MSLSAFENDSLNQLTLLSVIIINSRQNISIKSCLRIPENKQMQAHIGDTNFEIKNAHILTSISSNGHPNLVHHRGVITQAKSLSLTRLRNHSSEFKLSEQLELRGKYQKGGSQKRRDPKLIDNGPSNPCLKGELQREKKKPSRKPIVERLKELQGYFNNFLIHRMQSLAFKSHYIIGFGPTTQTSHRKFIPQKSEPQTILRIMPENYGKNKNITALTYASKTSVISLVKIKQKFFKMYDKISKMY